MNDMTQCNFFLWGFKDGVLVPPVPRDLVELREWIIGAFAAVTRDTLIKVLEEIEYDLDICHVLKCVHIETLHGVLKKTPGDVIFLLL